ncbi:hypothetical protein GCM10020331_090760 [Ectobacillus funiculus]
MLTTNKTKKSLEVAVTGELKPGITAKDLILGIIAKYGTDFCNWLCDRVYG